MAKRFFDPDAELALKVKETGDNDAMMSILDSHTGIYLQKVDRCLPDSWPEKREMIEDRQYKIFEYVQAYNPEKKMKLSTYIGQRAMWECRNIYNRTKKTEELEEGIDCSYEQCYDDHTFEIYKELNILAADFPDERARFIVDARTNDEPKTWKQIATDLGTNITTARKIYASFLKSAKKDLKKYD